MPKEKMPAVVHITNPRLKTIIGQLKSVGMFRCGVVSPLCNHAPEWQLEDTRVTDKKMFRMFCEHHAKYYAAIYGHELPAAPAELN